MGMCEGKCLCGMVGGYVGRLVGCVEEWVGPDGHVGVCWSLGWMYDTSPYGIHPPGHFYLCWAYLHRYAKSPRFFLKCY